MAGECSLKSGLASSTAEADEGEAQQEACDEIQRKQIERERALSSAISDLGSRSKLVSPILNNVTRVEALRAEALDLLKLLSIPQDVTAPEFLTKLRANRTKLMQRISEFNQINVDWKRRCQFPDDSKAWAILKFLDDPELSLVSQSAVASLVDSFPKWYWGEEEPPRGLLVRTSEALKVLDKRLSNLDFLLLKYNQGIVLAEVASSINRAQRDIEAKLYVTTLLNASRFDPFMNGSPEYKQLGLLLKGTRAGEYVLDRLRIGVRKAPTSISDLVAAAIETKIGLVERELSLLASIDMAGSTLRLRTWGQSRLEKLHDRCSGRPPTVLKSLDQLVDSLEARLEDAYPELAQLEAETAWRQLAVLESECLR
jgi:hypothetical protein